jgi:hypothetical protein
MHFGIKELKQKEKSFGLANQNSFFLLHPGPWMCCFAEINPLFFLRIPQTKKSGFLICPPHCGGD